MYIEYVVAIICVVVAVILALIGGLLIVIPERDDDGCMPEVEGNPATTRVINFFILGIFAVVLLILACVSSIDGAFTMSRTNADYYYYVDVYNMYYDMYDSDQTLANKGYTQTVISYNEWLVNARANQSALGKFSRWYNYDLYSLKYITMRGE